MAKPRIFLSSTFYDLKYIRNDLEAFIREIGYEPVLHERGHVPYGRMEALEEYCYKEISNCDVLIHIVGGRFGSESNEQNYSISQVELRTAHKLNKQVYIFIEKGVHFEYRTFLRNEKTKGFVPQFVDDLRIYNFIKEVTSLKANNPIFDFESAREVTETLREQWAGLFQRLLQQESRSEDYKISANLKATAEMLAKVVQYTTQQRDETIKALLIHSHPVFTQLAAETGIDIRILFTTKDEMTKLLRTFGYTEQTSQPEDQHLTFSGRFSNEQRTLEIRSDIFDKQGRLKPSEPDEWETTLVTIIREQVPDEDVPF
jgi:hypothetical protein